MKFNLSNLLDAIADFFAAPQPQMVRDMIAAMEEARRIS